MVGFIPLFELIKKLCNLAVVFQANPVPALLGNIKALMSSIDFELVDYSLIHEKFKSEKESIFRLEMLQSYSVEYEKENWRDFNLGKNPTLNSAMTEWCDIAASAKARDCKFERVRVVELPISEYLKFECQWAYSYSIPAGEDITVITSTDEFKEMLLASGLTILDYWLFSDSECYFMLYDLFGKFIGVAKNISNTGKYVDLKYECLNKSVDTKLSPLAPYIIL